MGCAPARRERRCTHFATVGSVPLVVQGDACARRRWRRDLAAADRLRFVHAGKRGPRPRRITQGVRQEATQARARRPWKCSPRAARWGPRGPPRLTLIATKPKPNSAPGAPGCAALLQVGQRQDFPERMGRWPTYLSADGGTGRDDTGGKAWWSRGLAH